MNPIVYIVIMLMMVNLNGNVDAKKKSQYTLGAPPPPPTQELMEKESFRVGNIPIPTKASGRYLLVVLDSVEEYDDGPRLLAGEEGLPEGGAEDNIGGEVTDNSKGLRIFRKEDIVQCEDPDWCAPDCNPDGTKCYFTVDNMRLSRKQFCLWQGDSCPCECGRSTDAGASNGNSDNLGASEGPLRGNPANVGSFEVPDPIYPDTSDAPDPGPARQDTLGGNRENDGSFDDTGRLDPGTSGGLGPGPIGPACQTTDGKTCALPFTYLEVSFNECTNLDNADGQPWCYTTEGNEDYGICNPECPARNMTEELFRKENSYSMDILSRIASAHKKTVCGGRGKRGRRGRRRCRRRGRRARRMRRMRSRKRG